mmetsp:Transcript_12818/g.37688  ORF Transcript_12818/g.37688 Transcript_12818/m.37688 type:complete len:362 (-) Transcript_12818:91-1176(-)
MGASRLSYNALDTSGSSCGTLDTLNSSSTKFNDVTWTSKKRKQEKNSKKNARRTIRTVHRSKRACSVLNSYTSLLGKLTFPPRCLTSSVSTDISDDRLLMLVKAEEWESVRSIISKKRAPVSPCISSSSPTTIDSLHPKKCDTQHSPIISRVLLSACRRNPPPDIVRSILELSPDAASQPDRLTERHPLHIALNFAASPECIAILIEASPASADAVDPSGKFPLHILCESYVNAYRERSETSRPKKKKLKGAKKYKNAGHMVQPENSILNKSITDIVKILRGAAPEVVNREDKTGVSALEYAVLNCLNANAMGVLHVWSQRDWKNRKRPGYGGGQEGLWDFEHLGQSVDFLWTERAKKSDK